MLLISEDKARKIKDLAEAWLDFYSEINSDMVTEFTVKMSKDFTCLEVEYLLSCLTGSSKYNSSRTI